MTTYEIREIRGTNSVTLASTNLRYEAYKIVKSPFWGIRTVSYLGFYQDRMAAEIAIRNEADSGLKAVYVYDSHGREIPGLSS